MQTIRGPKLSNTNSVTSLILAIARVSRSFPVVADVHVYHDDHSLLISGVAESLSVPSV